MPTTPEVQGPRPSWKSELAETGARARLFLSSYAPLFAIAAIQFDPRGLRLTCAGLAAAGLADAILLFRRSRKVAAARVITPVRVDDVGPEVAGYLATYLLPFVTVASPDWQDLVGYGLFLAVTLVIYVRSALVRVNPTFYLLGYRVFGVTVGTEKRLWVVARHEPLVDQPITVRDAAGVLLHVS